MKNTFSRSRSVALTIALPFVLAACASSAPKNPTFGERVAERGGTIANFGEEWTAGNNSVKSGEEMVKRSERDVKRAEKRLRDARRDVGRAEKELADANAAKVNGQRMIAQGTAQMAAAEENYRNLRRDGTVTVVPED